ncbi:hypothetical protein [Paenibacillus bovis]|uniref:Uncharacterized protein n=1 Tax=Paenibacillus bovis TaxID=1616788 RepID=A0A172ZF18_9BACL|nr:hypothetical protein [Paenibacillus bovis]ANF95972.1 hypothetical protein AR543_08100 [Paenibacillus bovis]
MKRELHTDRASAVPAAADRFRLQHVYKAWLFDSTVVSLLVSSLSSIYLNFALQNSVVVSEMGLRSQLIVWLLFLVPLFGYSLIVLAPLNRWLRLNIRRMPLQFLLFNGIGIIVSWAIMMWIPLPGWLSSPVLLWSIPVFSMISYLFSTVFLTSSPME